MYVPVWNQVGQRPPGGVLQGPHGVGHADREQRGVASLAAFKRGFRAGFLAGCCLLVCDQAGCGVCIWGLTWHLGYLHGGER